MHLAPEARGTIDGDAEPELRKLGPQQLARGFGERLGAAREQGLEVTAIAGDDAALRVISRIVVLVERVGWDGQIGHGEALVVR